MSRARVLADYVSSGDELALKAPLASPTFTGNIAMPDDSIDLAHMNANSVDSDQYVDGSIDLVHMSVNSVDSDQYVDGSIDSAHIANDQIDSQHYAAASIDNEHLADDAVGSDELANDVVINTSGAITTTGAFTSIGIDDNASGATAITIDSSENVAIGSATPERFTISGGSTVTDGTTLTIDSGPTANKMPKLELASYNVATNNDIGQIIFGNFGGDGTADGYGVITAEREATGGDGGIGLTFGTGSSGTERMRIDQDGNVGIGTTAPGANLEVTGAASTADTQMFRLSNAGALAYYWEMWRDNTDGDLRFGEALGGSKTTYMTLQTGGNVGIGTLTPSVALDVEGATATIHVNATSGNSNMFLQVNGANKAGFESSGNDLYITAQDATGDMYFRPGNTTAVTFKRDGKVGIGITAPPNLFTVQQLLDSLYVGKFISGTPAVHSGGQGLRIECGNSSSQSGISCRNFEGTTRAQIQMDGSMQCSTGTYGSSVSDERMKENIVDGSPKLDQLNELRVVNFNFKDDDLKQLGFIAQEVEEIFPALLIPTDSRTIATQEEYDEKPEAEQDNYVKDVDGEWCRKMSNGEILGFKDSMGLKTSILIPILVKAVQELSAKNDTLEARVTALENA